MLQVVLSLNPGGTERLVIDLASRLHGTLPMAVCCLDDAGAWAPELTSIGIPVDTLGRRPGFQPALGRRIAAAAARHRADVIHAHHYSPFVYSCLARLTGGGAPIVFTEHGRLSDAGPSAKRRLANHLLSRVPAAVAAVSGELARHLEAEGFRSGQVQVIYNGIDVGPEPPAGARDAMRRSLGITADTFVVGSVGRLDPVKDLRTLVQAFASHKTGILLIVGDGAERPALEAAAAARAPGRIRFLGHRADARDVLAACDVYVNSSLSEGISLTVLEAMAAGLPVVATAVGGTPEIVDSSCAVLVSARDAGAMADALAALAADADRRRRLGAAGRARVEARFTLARMVDDYRAAYLRAAGAMGRR